MPSYAVSFEIHSDATYLSRYTSLMEQVREHPSVAPWMETTSFVLVDTEESLEAFAHRLYFGSKLIDSKDILLVFDPARSSAIARGPIEYPATLGSKFRHFVKM
jgi:hypothetical protein